MRSEVFPSTSTLDFATMLAISPGQWVMDGSPDPFPGALVVGILNHTSSPFRKRRRDFMSIWRSGTIPDNPSSSSSDTSSIFRRLPF